MMLTGIALMGTIYFNLMPEPKQLTPERREVMREAVAKILESFPKPEGKVAKISVAPLEGDISREIADEIRKTLDAEGRYNVAPPPIGDRARVQLRMAPREINSEKEGVRYGAYDGSESVLWGKVRQLSSDQKGVVVDLELNLTDTATNKLIWRNALRYQPGELKELLNPVSNATGFWSKVWKVCLRTLIALLICCILPLIFMRPIRSMLEKKSNKINFFVISSLILINLILFLVLLQGIMSPFFHIALTIGLTILSGWYNYWICGRLDENV